MSNLTMLDLPCQTQILHILRDFFVCQMGNFSNIPNATMCSNCPSGLSLHRVGTLCYDVSHPGMLGDRIAATARANRNLCRCLYFLLHIDTHWIPQRSSCKNEQIGHLIQTDRQISHLSHSLIYLILIGLVYVDPG